MRYSLCKIISAVDKLKNIWVFSCKNDFRKALWHNLKVNITMWINQYNFQLHTSKVMSSQELTRSSQVAQIKLPAHWWRAVRASDSKKKKKKEESMVLTNHWRPRQLKIEAHLRPLTLIYSTHFQFISPSNLTQLNQWQSSYPSLTVRWKIYRQGGVSIGRDEENDGQTRRAGKSILQIGTNFKVTCTVPWTESAVCHPLFL